MKMLRLPSFSLHFSVIMLAAILFVGCATKVPFNGSSVVPGADGTVKVKKDNNKNYAIKLSVYNLAPSQKLTPSKNTYVVWMETDQNITKNIGQLNSASGLFSKALKAEMETVSAVKPTKIYITAEDDPSVTYPSGQVVLTTASIP